jgi:dipeptidyl aminopeptidase/acylaminoacyl peptidase
MILLRICRGRARQGGRWYHVDVSKAVVLPGALVALALAVAGTASPAGPASFLAYSDGSGSLYTSNLSGGGAKQLFQGDSSTSMQALDVSNDGKQVLALDYGNQAQLALVPAAGGSPSLIAGTVNAGTGSLSPDGSTVAFSLDGTQGTLAAGIYTVAAAGGTPKVLVTSPSGATDSLPTYSPDGKTIAFVRDAYDNMGNETVSLELVPVAGGTPKVLTTGLAPDLSSGNRLSFSPDGKQLAYAGDFTRPGIYTVPVAGGTPNQLTSDYDYWPSFSADGSKVYFARDATSANADDNQTNPVAPANVDLYELWTVKSDGTGAAVAAEGDFEDLVLAAIVTSGATTTTPGAPAPAPAPPANNGNPPASPTTPAAGKSTTKAVVASAVRVTVKDHRYDVTWRGKAASWTVLLKVGKRTATARVKGSVHAHVFVLPGARGAASARVKSG